MLLFKKRFWDGLRSGAITLTFRRWQKPRVRVGRSYRCHPIGVLIVDAVEKIEARSITEDDARKAGFESRDELISHLAELGPVVPATPVYRVELHHGGESDHVALANDADLSPDDVAAIQKRLLRIDPHNVWTRVTLELIAKKPRVVAKQLAAELGRERDPFKQDVRKLKRMGLTQSFEVGYALTARGKAYLAAVRKVERAKVAKTPARSASR